MIGMRFMNSIDQAGKRTLLVQHPERDTECFEVFKLLDSEEDPTAQVPDNGLSASLTMTDFISKPHLRSQLEAALIDVDETRDTSSSPKALSELALGPALEPRVIFCCGQNYRSHLDEKPPVVQKAPRFFAKVPGAVAGNNQTLSVSTDLSGKLDYEVELGVVIGKEAIDISPSEAWDHIFGYVVLNDVTARDWQVEVIADNDFRYDIGRAKSFDGSCAVGQSLVTTDEIPDPNDLWLRCDVNDEKRQEGTTAQMIWKVNEIVSYYSSFLTLQPGTVIATGTPGGTAWGADPYLGGTRTSRGQGLEYLSPGDTVKCSIQHLGSVTTKIGAPRAESQFAQYWKETGQ